MLDGYAAMPEANWPKVDNFLIDFSYENRGYYEAPIINLALVANKSPFFT